jgi:hypothetical protein
MSFWKKIYHQCVINGNFPIFAPVNPRENGLMKKAHFSLYSANGELGQFFVSRNKEKEVFPLVSNHYYNDISSGAILDLILLTRESKPNH